MVYENHCELHRAACILNRPIAFQKIERCSTLSKKKISKLEHSKFVHHSKVAKPPPAVEQHHHETVVIYRETTPATQTTTQIPENKTNFFNDEFPAIQQQPPHYLKSQTSDGFEIIETTFNDIESSRYTQKGYCSSQEYEIMKDNLLLYSHTRLMTQDNNHSKDFLVSIMFSHYDQNNNGHLEMEELNKISIAEHLEDLSNGCALTDMLVFDDSNSDQMLSINEFYQAFNKLYSKFISNSKLMLFINHI